MNRIRDLREDRDLRQSDLAEKVKIDQRTLSNYETGKTNPDSESLIKLADYFDVSIDFLVGREEKKKKENSVFEIIENMQLELENIKKHIEENTKKQY